MEGILSANVKRIIFTGSSVHSFKQDANIFKNISIEESSFVSETDIKFNKWLEKVQKELENIRKKKINNVNKKLQREENKKQKNDDIIENLEEELEETSEWNLILEILNVQSHYHGALKIIEVTYRITEYMID